MVDCKPPVAVDEATVIPEWLSVASIQNSRTASILFENLRVLPDVDAKVETVVTVVSASVTTVVSDPSTIVVVRGGTTVSSQSWLHAYTMHMSYLWL